MNDPTEEKHGWCSYCGHETINDWCSNCGDYDDHCPDPDSMKGGHDYDR